MRYFSVTPSRNPIAIKERPSFLPISQIVQIFGWFRAETARASRRNRSNALRVLRDIFGEKLQEDEAPKLGILWLVDDAHAPATELLDDAAMRDGLADRR